MKKNSIEKVKAEFKEAEARYLKDLGKPYRVTRITHFPNDCTMTLATLR